MSPLQTRAAHIEEALRHAKIALDLAERHSGRMDCLGCAISDLSGALRCVKWELSQPSGDSGGLPDIETWRWWVG